MDRQASPRVAVGASEPGFVTGASDAPARRPGRGLVRFGIGAFVLGIVGFIGGFVLMGLNAFDAVQDGLDPQADLDVSVGVPGSGATELAAGRYQVVVLGETLLAVSGMSSDAGGQTVTRLPFAEPAVTVSGPDGAAVDLEAPSHDRLSSTPGLDAVGIAEFTAPVAGTYTVTVVGEPGAVTTVGVDEAGSLWEGATPWIRSSAVTAVGGVLMAVGITSLVSGALRSLLGAGLADLRRHGHGR